LIFKLLLLNFYDELKCLNSISRTYCKRMQEENIHRAIIVVQASMTPSAKQSLMDMAPKYILEQVNHFSLIFDVFD